MNIINSLSFLENKSLKVKITFCFVIFLSTLIVLADVLSIISLLPLVSIFSDSNFNFDQNNSYFKYLPIILKNYFSQLTSWKIFTLLLLILFLRNLIYLLNNFIIFKFIKFLEVDTSNKIFFLWLNKNYLNFYEKNSSELIKDFRDSVGGYVMYIENITRFISDFLILIFFGIFLLIISFNETLIVFFYYFLIFICFKKIISKFSLKYGEIANLTSNKINLTIINTYKNFSQIILRKLKKNFLNLMSKYIDRFSYSRLIVSFINSNTKPFFEISIIIFFTLLILFFDFFSIYSIEELTVLFVIFIVAAYRILPQINNLVSSLIKIKNFQYPFNIIDEQIKIFNSKFKKIEFTDESKKKLTFKKDIILQNIFFKYKSNQKYFLNNINLKINKNQRIGLIGNSGSGKTTIIKILLGLIKPDKGEILIDGKKLNLDELKNYQNLFSYLSQENLFIPASIKENIAFGDINVNEEKLHHSLRLTNCLEFVDKLDQKINHKITEDGKNFSFGQLQRLALARAIYFDNEILILDEPTSSLDSVSENKFLKLIDKLKDKKTIIIISHKKETLKNCDLIYEISDQNLVKKI